MCVSALPRNNVIGDSVWHAGSPNSLLLNALIIIRVDDYYFLATRIRQHVWRKALDFRHNFFGPFVLECGSFYCGDFPVVKGNDTSS